MKTLGVAMKTLGAVLLACAFLWGLSARADAVYVTGNGGTGLFVVNSSTGAGTFIGNFGFKGVLTDSFDSKGNLYVIIKGGSTASQLATVNLLTGAATPIGSATGIAGLVAMEFAPIAPDGKHVETLYAASLSTNELYTVSLTTGFVKDVGSLGFANVMDLAWDPFNSTMYAIASSGAPGTGSFLYSLNLGTGLGTLETTSANDCLMGLTIDSANQFLAMDHCDSNSPLYQIDPTTGALNSLGNTGISLSMGAATQTPEPTTLLLLGSGLLALAFFGRKKLPWGARA